MSAMGKRSTPVVRNTSTTEAGGDVTFMRVQKVGLLGADSSAFVDLFQLQATACLPSNGTNEIGVNSTLAMVEPAKPEKVERALGLQIPFPHTAAMAVLARLGGGSGRERGVAALRLAPTRLPWVYAYLSGAADGSMRACGVAKGRLGIIPSEHSATPAFLRA